MQPDRIVIKEMESYLRGREPGEIPALLRDELSRQGAPADMVAVGTSPATCWCCSVTRHERGRLHT